MSELCVRLKWMFVICFSFQSFILRKEDSLYQTQGKPTVTSVSELGRDSDDIVKKNPRKINTGKRTWDIANQNKRIEYHKQTGN